MLFWTHQLWDLTWRFIWNWWHLTTGPAATVPDAVFHGPAVVYCHLKVVFSILSMTKINYAWTLYYILCKVFPKYYRWENLIFVWFLIFQLLFTLMWDNHTAVNNTITWWIPLKWLDSYWISSCSPKQAIEWVSSNIFQTAKSHSKIKNNLNICFSIQV